MCSFCSTRATSSVSIIDHLSQEHCGLQLVTLTVSPFGHVLNPSTPHCRLTSYRDPILSHTSARSKPLASR